MVAWTGKKAVGGIAYATEVTTLGVLAVRELFRPARAGRREIVNAIVRQIAFTGIDALPFAAVAGTMVGFIIIMQAALKLPQVGAGEYLAGVLILSIVYEIGPLVAAFVMLWRSGTAMCTELGNMQVSGEIAALDAMGASIERYLVLPRLVGGMIALIVLIVYFDAIALIGGFFIAQTQLTIPLFVYLSEIQQVLEWEDFLVTPVKGSIFAVVIVLVCCHHGLSVRSSPAEVPQQTTQAMLRAVACCFLADVLLAPFIYG